MARTTGMANLFIIGQRYANSTPVDWQNESSSWW